MVRFHEDAYWLNNLSLFALNIERHWGQKKQKYGGNQAPSVTIYIFGVLNNVFLITGCPKNGQNLNYFWDTL